MADILSNWRKLKQYIGTANKFLVMTEKIVGLEDQFLSKESMNDWENAYNKENHQYTRLIMLTAHSRALLSRKIRIETKKEYYVECAVSGHSTINISPLTVKDEVEEPISYELRRVNYQFRQTEPPTIKCIVCSVLTILFINVTILLILYYKIQRPKLFYIM